MSLPFVVGKYERWEILVNLSSLSFCLDWLFHTFIVSLTFFSIGDVEDFFKHGKYFLYYFSLKKKLPEDYSAALCPLESSGRCVWGVITHAYCIFNIEKSSVRKPQVGDCLFDFCLE